MNKGSRTQRGRSGLQSASDACIGPRPGETSPCAISNLVQFFVVVFHIGKGRAQRKITCLRSHGELVTVTSHQVAGLLGYCIFNMQETWPPRLSCPMSDVRLTVGPVVPSKAERGTIPH